MSALMILHCIFNLIYDLKQGTRGLYVMTTFYIGCALTTFADMYYIDLIDNSGISEYSMYRYIVPQYTAQAMQVWLIGNSFIFIGYDVFSKKSFRSISFDIKNEKVLRNLFNFIVGFAVLNLSGVAARLGFISGGLTKVLSLLNLMGILFYARLWVKENSKRYRSYAIMLCIMQTTIALFVSYLRIELLTPTLALFGGYFIGMGKIRYVFTFRVVPLIVILAIFSVFFNTLAGNRSNFIGAFTGDNNRYVANQSYEDLSAKDRKQGGVFERSANIAQLTNIIDLTERNGFYQGAASAPLVYAFIPRLLWPDKPRIQLGAWFALEIGMAHVSETTGRINNSINMSIPGELYLDFGWIGLVVGCFFFGGLVAMFWNAARFNESFYNLNGALWGGYLLLYALFGIGVDLQIIVSLFSTYFVFLFLKYFLRQYENTLSRSLVAG